jgi:hypothetical protein
VPETASDLLRRVVDDYGVLVSIAGASSEPRETGRASRFNEYTFGFEAGILTVAAHGPDDTIRLLESATELLFISTLTMEPPWASAVACGVTWVWRLTNQQGYPDGLQVEFGSDSGLLSVQLMCETAALTAKAVVALDGQFSG